MISIKGFGINTNLTNNVKDVVNNIGELSAWSSTYSKDRGIYYQDDTDAIVLTTFSTKRDGKDIVLSISQRQHIIKIIKWVYTKCIAKGGEVYAHELLQDLIDTFSNEAEDFKSGEIVKDANFYMPSWLSWKLKSSEETFIRIWFSDEVFKRTYDEYEIVVIPPLKPLDDFFKVSSTVQTLLDARTPMKRMDEVQDAKEDKPETIIRTEMFHYVDPLDQTNKIKTYWDVLIYGEAGNNIDSIKDAIIDYILNNTKKTRDEWTNIFPDIFKRTEFILLPNWASYAIPNRITEAGIHSPVVVHKDIIPEIRKFATLYPVAHVNAHTQIMSHPYKSLMMTTISSNENRDNLFKITDVFPDYIAQSSTSQDFNRQSESTREWAEKISQMLIIAEDMTPFTDIPRGMTRLLRNNKLYLVISYANIHYLVVAKHNYPKT